MNNKNIIFGMSLDQYKKKYHNRSERLIKLTKKEVSDFDKKYPTSQKDYLLKTRKWTLIGDTYYEIPKAPRFTWFRNLHAGTQIATSVLAAGVVATAITLPIVLNKKTVENTIINIEGDVEIDKDASVIELNKNSTLVLKEKAGRSISYIEEVKVGDKVLNEYTEWEYGNNNNNLIIYANAMTSLDITIKVKTEQSGPIEVPEYFVIEEIAGTTNCSIKIKSNEAIEKAPTIINIPSQVIKDNKTYTVTKIPNMGFCPTGFPPDLKDKTIILPKTLKTIDGQGFGFSSKIKRVVLNEGLSEIGVSSFNCSIDELNIVSTVVPEKGHSYVFSGTFKNVVINNKECINLPKTDEYAFGYLLENANNLYIKEDSVPPADSYIVNKYNQVTSDRPTYTKWTKKTTWTCNMCGYTDNPESATVCTHCGTPRT